MTDEALTEHLHAGDQRRLVALAELLEPTRRVRIVDIGANPIDDEPQYAGLLATGLGQVTGFEPQAQALERLRRAAGPFETYLPDAIGDGAVQELRVCTSDGFSSLFEPDPQQLALLTDFPAMAGVVQRHRVPTTRLDDVAGIEGIDYLKMDLQGGELAVIGGASRRLAEVVAVQTEVGFHRLYQGAPTFAEVDLALRSVGLVPQQFVSTRTWPLAPTQWADPWQPRSRQLVEADLLYVRDLTTVAHWTADQLKALALVSFSAYDSVGLVLHCVGELTRRGDLPKDAPTRCHGLIG